MLKHLILAAIVATVPTIADAAQLPGQATRYCDIPSGIEIGGARASAGSPFLGIFDGRWDGVLPVTLVIYEVEGTRAYGYYAWKDYGPWKVKAGCRPVLGRISGDTLTFRGDDHMTFIATGKRLAGTYVFSPGTSGELIEKSSFTRKK